MLGFLDSAPIVSSSTVSVYPVLNHLGLLHRIQVYRNGILTSYERTSRNAEALFDSKDGEFSGFFSESRAFYTVFQGKNVLDLGCGDGGLVHDLRRNGVQAHGVDLFLTPRMKRQSFFLAGDAFALPIQNESIDTVVSTWSVFHYESIDSIPVLLQECDRVLKHGGRLLIAPLFDLKRVIAVRAWCGENSFHVFQSGSTATLQLVKA